MTGIPAAPTRENAANGGCPDPMGVLGSGLI